ncbi:uncharacterized protein LOC117333526 [Pecten maximus]|uniref:uncharacterized protein LOC117333526 n=1 Tax=Pecten maximus TaxID=6579 RepID=UPI0014588165|nr:uncharacterized protein LOC117333526 [Pecten maximus]
MIGFMGNKIGEDTKLEITITNPNDNITNVSVALHPDQSFSPMENGFLLYPGGYRNITMPSNFAVNESGKGETGVRIESDNPTIVYGSSIETGHTSMDSFLSIPQIALGNLYYAITGINRAQLLVVGLHPRTSVNITLRTDRDASYQGSFYSSGQTIQETLNEYQTLQVESKRPNADFTGTSIRSSKPVSVYSGSRFSSSSFLVEQMPTVAFWDTHHVTVPPDDNSIYNTTIVSACKDTLVRSLCTDGSKMFFTLTGHGNFQRMPPSNASCSILTSEPVEVAIEIYGPTNDASMTIIQPMRKVFKDLKFLVPDIIRNMHFTLVFVTYCDTYLSLDGVTISSLKLTALDEDSVICMGRISIGSGGHVISSSGVNFFISGYLHGTKGYNTIAFPLVPHLDSEGEQPIHTCDYTSIDSSSPGTSITTTGRDYEMERNEIKTTMETTVEATVEATTETTIKTTMEITVEATMEITGEATMETTVEATMGPTVEATMGPTLESTTEAAMDTDNGMSSPSTRETSGPLTSVSGETDTSPSRSLEGLCRCSCSYKTNDRNTTLKTMKNKLSIPRNKTRRYIRSLTSAPDDRPSSKTIGITASVVIGLVLFTILFLDCTHLMGMFRRIKRMSRHCYNG